AGGGGPGIDLGGRPHDRPVPVLVDADLGPGGGEVVELLRVQLRHRVEVPAVDEVAHRAARRVAGVVPPLERRDGHRLVELRADDPAHVLHGPTVPASSPGAAHPGSLPSGTRWWRGTTIPACVDSSPSPPSPWPSSWRSPRPQLPTSRSTPRRRRPGPPPR